MRSSSFLTLGGLIAVTSAALLPIEAQQTHLTRRAYKDVTQVLERITLTITKCADDVRQWPGNPRLATTVPQISQWAQIIIQDSNSLLSDLLVGTDYIKRNQQTSIKSWDSVTLLPKLATLDSAVGTYTAALIEKRGWADSSSTTSAIYDRLVLHKQRAHELSEAITQSLSITTSWASAPINSLFFGNKLDDAIKAYARGPASQPLWGSTPPEAVSPAGPSGLDFGPPLQGQPTYPQQGSAPAWSPPQQSDQPQQPGGWSTPDQAPPAAAAEGENRTGLSSSS
jgi:hypothetical protein